MDYGVTESGFNTKRLPVIKYELGESFKELLGEIDISEGAPLGQIIGIMSRFLAELSEEIGYTYEMLHVLSAKGVNLDRLVALNLLTRLAATSTKVYVQFLGTEGTVIPSGFLASTSNTAEQFEMPNEITISRTSVNKVVCNIASSADGEYAIVINDVNIVVTASSNTQAEIAELLVDLVNTSYSSLASAIDLTNGEFSVNSLTQEQPINYDIRPDSISKILISDIYTPGILYSINVGAILAISNTLTVIDTPISGLDSIGNMYDGENGRGIETDNELIVRRSNSFKIVGAGNLEAITSKMLATIPNVTAVIGYENTTDNIDASSRPPHSMEIVVQNGSNEDISNSLWLLKPGGIALFGNANSGAGYTIQDSQGNNQIIKFSRPIVKYAHIKVIVVSYYDEEQFPENGSAMIKESVLAFLNSLKIGEDIILQRVVGPVYTTVPGIAEMTIEGDLTDLPTDSPTYATANLPLGAAEIADYDTTRIPVELP